jgi:hypothetical protein
MPSAVTEATRRQPRICLARQAGLRVSGGKPRHQRFASGRRAPHGGPEMNDRRPIPLASRRNTFSSIATVLRSGRSARGGLMEACAAELEGQVSPEFLQCQIEIGTRVCAPSAEARDDLKRLRATVAKSAANSASPHRRLLPPLRRLEGPAPHRQGPLQRAGPRSGRRGAADADLRDACACRPDDDPTAHRPDGAAQLFPAASAGAVGLLALLAGRGHRAGLLPADGLRQPAAHRPAAAVRLLGEYERTTGS